MNYLNDIIKIMEPVSEFAIADDICKVKKDKTVLEFTIEANNIVPLHKNLLSNHFVRIARIRGFGKITESNVFDIFTFLDGCDIHSFCTVCGCNVQSFKTISCCNSENCTKQFMRLVTANTIIQSYLTDKITFNFLMITAYSCLKHPQRNDIFKPFPICFSSFEDLDSKLTYGHKTFKDLLKVIGESKTDYELCDAIGQYDYSFLKYIIGTNTMNLKSDLLFTEDKNIFNQKNLDNIFDHDDVISFKVEHDPLTEKKFKTVNPQYLFHGSTISNFYSILKNGLKVYSGTKMQLHGAAHGIGIYLSDTMNYSHNYGIDKYCASGLNVYGVFQVLQDKSVYKKTHQIYVVANDTEVILRYLIVIKAGGKGSKKLTDMDNYFLVQREREIKSATDGYNILRAKRIAYDMSKIEKISEQYGFNCNGNEGNSVLSLTKGGTKICIQYHEDYPSSPPFIWIVETNKKIENDDILKKGAVLNSKLSYKTWSSSTEIHKIIKELLKSVTDVQGEFKKYIEEDAFAECIEVSKMISN